MLRMPTVGTRSFNITFNISMSLHKPLLDASK
jgi:hypothetical protein